MGSIVGIGHWALRVKDLDRSIAFYRDKLDFAEMFRLDRDGTAWRVFLRVTDTQSLELLPDGVGEPPPPEQVGPSHICIEVADVEPAVASLEKAGVELSRPIVQGPGGSRIAWIEDPDGNRIELVDRQVEAVRRLRGNGERC